MVKKVFVLAVFMTVLVSAALGVKPNVVNAARVSDKVTICHRTNSVSNPYNALTVDADSADGNTGNDHGQADHSTHTGPVATTPQVAQALKNQKIDWGDIIPPHNSYGGLNWSAAGQAIYENECTYTEPDFDQPLITATVDCAEVNGVAKVQVVLTNDGLVDGVAIVNSLPVDLPAKSSVTLNYDNGSTVTVVIDQQTVFDQALTCGGRGGPDTTTTTPTTTTPQVQAPKAGVNAGGASAVVTLAGLVASAAALAYGLFRARKFSL